MSVGKAKKPEAIVMGSFKTRELIDLLGEELVICASAVPTNRHGKDKKFPLYVKHPAVKSLLLQTAAGQEFLRSRLQPGDVNPAAAGQVDLEEAIEDPTGLLGANGYYRVGNKTVASRPTSGAGAAEQPAVSAKPVKKAGMFDFLDDL